MFVILASIASVCLIVEFLIWLVKKDHFGFKIFRLIFKIIFKISFIILYYPVFIKFQNSMMMMKQSEITISSLEVKNQHSTWETLIQVILFEIDCAIFYTNLYELFCQFISWTNWVNSGKFMDNCWISCQVMADYGKILRQSHNY